MQFFVIWPDGQKFGPADLNQLNNWIQENRINGDTELESVVDGSRIKAKDLPGIILNSPVASEPIVENPSVESPVATPQAPADPTPVTPTTVDAPIQYFVLGSGGQKYGPADAATLTQWAAESRLTPTTELENSVTGERVMASQVAGIIFPMANAGASSAASPVASPYGQQSNYPRQDYTASGEEPGKKEVTYAFVLSALGLFCCCFAHIGALIFAYKAKQMGNPNAKVAIIVGWVVLALTLVWTMIQIPAVIAAMNQAGSGGGF